MQRVRLHQLIVRGARQRFGENIDERLPRNEGIALKHLYQAMEIYAEAIYQLCCK